jgi:hypothetical protein
MHKCSRAIALKCAGGAISCNHHALDSGVVLSRHAPPEGMGGGDARIGPRAGPDWDFHRARPSEALGCGAACLNRPHWAPSPPVTGGLGGVAIPRSDWQAAPPLPARVGHVPSRRTRPLASRPLASRPLASRPLASTSHAKARAAWPMRRQGGLRGGPPDPGPRCPDLHRSRADERSLRPESPGSADVTWEAKARASHRLESEPSGVWTGGRRGAGWWTVPGRCGNAVESEDLNRCGLPG